MGIVDGALFGIEILEDLQQPEIPADQEKLGLTFKPAALDRSILRKCTKAKSTIEGIMPKSAFLRIYRATLENEGYFCGTSIHAIKRYLGKTVDGMSYSEGHCCRTLLSSRS